MPAGTHVHSRSRGTAFHTPSPIPGEMVLSLHSSQLPRPQPAAILDLGLLGFLFSCGFLPVLAQSEAPASAADKGFMLHSALTDCCAAPTLSRMASQLCRAWASAPRVPTLGDGCRLSSNNPQNMWLCYIERLNCGYCTMTEHLPDMVILNKHAQCYY